MKESSYNVNNAYAACGITQSLTELCNDYKNIAFICIGTDANMGDSLAPFVGSIMSQKINSHFIYGSLENPITAKEVPYIEGYIKKAHPCTFTVVIDAAVGKKEDVGLIKILSGGIKPGLGVNKTLPELGDASIIGVISEKSQLNFSMLNLTRLSSVYRMAKVISQGINDFICLREANKARSDNVI